MPRPPKPVDIPTSQIPRFWSLIDPPDGDACRIYHGTVDAYGYGQFSTYDPARFRDRTHKAHRVAYALTHGDTDRPIRRRPTCDLRCCNPDHFTIVPPKEA